MSLVPRMFASRAIAPSRSFKLSAPLLCKSCLITSPFLPQRRPITNATKPDHHPSLLSFEHSVTKPGNWKPTLIHSSGHVKFTVIRVPPSGEVPTHYHNHCWDYFMPISGDGVITTRSRKEIDGELGEEVQHVMDVNGFLAVPPGDVHVVRNRAKEGDFVFLLAQSPREKYDFVDAKGNARGDWGDYKGE